MIGTRFIPTWEELKQAQRVKLYRRFYQNDSEIVSTSLLIRIFLYAAKNGERVVFPAEWEKSDKVSREQYELWYSTYYKKSQSVKYHDEFRSFSEKRTLNSSAWKFILEGEEED